MQKNKRILQWDKSRRLQPVAWWTRWIIKQPRSRLKSLNSTSWAMEPEAGWEEERMKRKRRRQPGSQETATEREGKLHEAAVSPPNKLSHHAGYFIPTLVHKELKTGFQLSILGFLETNFGCWRGSHCNLFVTYQFLKKCICTFFVFFVSAISTITFLKHSSWVRKIISSDDKTHTNIHLLAFFVLVWSSQL